MKKMIALAIAAALAVSVLAGCSSKKDSGSSEKTPAEMTQSYVDAINGSVDKEILEYTPVVTDIKDQDAEMIIDVLGLKPEQMQAYAMSVSLMNVQAYAIAVIMPAEGQAEAVKTALQTFVDNQASGFERYLEDQYEIAKNAKLETLEDGTILLVMTEGQDTVFEGISNAILGK